MKWYIPAGVLGALGLATLASEYYSPSSKSEKRDILLGSPVKEKEPFKEKDFEKIVVNTPEGEKTYTVIQSGTSGKPKPPIQTAPQPQPSPPTTTQIIPPQTPIYPQTPYFYPPNIPAQQPYQPMPQVGGTVQTPYGPSQSVPQMSWEDQLITGLIGAALPGITQGIQQGSQAIGQGAGQAISGFGQFVGNLPSQGMDLINTAISYFTGGDDII